VKKNLKLKGYVTIVVLILMSVLVAVSYLYADALFSELAIARNNKGSTVAFALAEAGVQEAIYKVRYDPGIKAHFLTGSGSDILPLKPALINNGSYKVTLIYTNPATATIESTGFYQMGLRTAQRRITENIDQATLPLIWDIGAAIFTSPGSAPNNLTNIDLKNAKTIRIYNGGIFSGLDLNTKNVTNIAAEGRIRSMGIIDSQGTKNCQCKIADDNDPSTPQCFNNPDYGCQVEPHSSLSDPENGTPPSGSADYKLQAISAGTCYNGVAPCNKPFPTSSTLTGIIYVEGGLEINHDLTINGLLVTSGNLDVKAVLTVNKTGDEPSGIIVDPGNFYSKRTLNVTGVIWVAQSIYVNNGDINLTGGIIVHDIYINNSSTIIHYDPQVINETLKPTSQVIELKHWEEEY
jgi:hypothetical protein